MAFFEPEDLKELVQKSRDEANEWRRDYPEFERLADNGLLEDLDEELPEVNDGSLAASLHKLPKRVVGDLTGRFTALDAEDAWITELANIYWTKKILPNANSQAGYKRKQKDVVRKAAIYGSQPVVCLLVDDGKGGVKADFIVPYVQDIYLEAGKVSDLDSDVIFWDVYYTRKQVLELIETAKGETEKKQDGNTWDIEALERIYTSKQDGEDRNQNEDHESKSEKSVTKGGIKFCIAFQRGVDAPFYMYHKATNATVRTWKNPDPTGDIPVKFMYCYQDFNNPYGIGVVKLAGGQQNVLDVMRKYDVYATQRGLRPPRAIRGNEDDVDEDTMDNSPDANWFLGNAEVSLVETTNRVYEGIPTRISMYKTSLNSIIPTGDTSISAEAGDPQYSKTPAGVKFQQSQLSVDDSDFKDNLNEWWEDVAKVLINLAFSNMEGSDLLHLSDDERDVLMSAGLEFPMTEDGSPTNDLQIIWENARATFDFELNAEDDQIIDEEKQLEGLMKVVELRSIDPTIDQSLLQAGQRLNLGELFSSIISLTTKNKKILEKISPEEMANMQASMAQTAVEPVPTQEPQPDYPLTPENMQANIEGVMEQYGVDETTALEMLDAAYNGTPIEEVQDAVLRMKEDQQYA